MKRLIFNQLRQWKNAPYRKSLIIRGARQVGKTHTVRQFGKEFKHFVEINFEQHPETCSIFERDLDPERILLELQVLTNKPILPGKTLLFFDEIQVMPRAMIALRYFYEKMPSLHVIAAGSLLNFAIEKVGVPVGRVNFLYMYPMSFMEFLAANDYTALMQTILNQSCEHQLSDMIHQKALSLLREYFVVGGMPEAIAVWRDTKDLQQCAHIQANLIKTYQQDIAKYAKKTQIKYVDLLFKQLAHQLAKPFKFSKVEGDYRKRELAPALDLLQKAGLAHRVYRTAAQGFPLGATTHLDKYKVILLDIALTQIQLGNKLGDWLLEFKQMFINQGDLVEAFVGQELLCYETDSLDENLYYWQRNSKGSQAEIDYILQLDQTIVPIAVKSQLGSSMKSMHLFLKEHTQASYGVRFSTHNFSIHNKIHSYPLYAIANLLGIKEYINLALG